MPPKIGLSFSKKPTSSNAASKPAPSKRKPVFGAEDGSDEEASEASKPSTTTAQAITTFDDQTPAPPSPSDPKSKLKHTAAKPPPPKKTTVPQTATAPTLSSTLHNASVRKTAETLDANIYDYDATYATTSSHAAETARRAAAREQAESGVPLYMQNMQAAAKQRERDQLRAKDRLLQKEREAEGEELADAEQFVTGAYREQQESVRREEEEERKREERAAKEREKGGGKGMRGFWKGMMDEEEERHRMLAEGLIKPASTNGEADSTDALQSPEEKEQAATALARDMNAKGANITINDDGQVTDKRQLLTAGLNVAPLPKSKSSPTKSDSASAKPTSDQQRAAQAAQPQRHVRDAREAQRERQTRMMEAQLEASQKRAAEEEAEALQKREMNSKSAKTGGEISSAKERYLQRKREAEAARARGEM